MKTKEIDSKTEFGYVKKNLHKLTQISSEFSPKILICFRCNTKQSEECFITYPNTWKCFKKTRLRLVLSTHFSVFGYVMKHFSSCFIYHFTSCSSLTFALSNGRGFFISVVNTFVFNKQTNKQIN